MSSVRSSFAKSEAIYLPSWPGGGGRDIKKDIAKLPLMEQTGWWSNFN